MKIARQLVGLLILFGVSGAAHAEGWIYMGEATPNRWRTASHEWNNSDVYGTNYPGSASPTTSSRTTAPQCRAWAKKIAREYYLIGKDSRGYSQMTWPSWADAGYSSTVQRQVRLRWKRWTTWTGFLNAIPKNHCRIYAEEYAENLSLDSGEDMVGGDVMFWLHTDAANNPDMVGAAIQGVAEHPSLHGKAAHIGMCGAVNTTGECYSVRHAHDYGTLEGTIGHRSNWQLNVGEYLYDALRHGLTKHGVKRTHSAIAENRHRTLHVFRSCDQSRIDLAQWRFWDHFEAMSKPESQRRYRVAAFTQIGPAELEYGQCAATQKSLWDLTASEGGNSIYMSATDYETSIGDAWNAAHSFMDEYTSGLEGVVVNERRVASAVVHAFADTGKSWSQVKDPDSDSAARAYTRASAAAKNPAGLQGISSPVAQFVALSGLSVNGCSSGPVVTPWLDRDGPGGSGDYEGYLQHGSPCPIGYNYSSTNTACVSGSCFDDSLIYYASGGVACKNTSTNSCGDWKVQFVCVP